MSLILPTHLLVNGSLVLCLNMLLNITRRQWDVNDFAAIVNTNAGRICTRLGCAVAGVKGMVVGMLVLVLVTVKI